MKPWLKFSRIALLLMAVIVSAGLSNAWPVTQASTPPAPEATERLAQVWQNARASGAYTYRATLHQTTYPAPKLSNAGRAPRVESLALAGQFDQWAETLNFTLWRDGSFDPHTGINVKVENGQAYARRGTAGQWQAVDNFTGSFAPGGDPLAFLTGITDIQRGEAVAYVFGEDEGEVASEQSTVNSLQSLDFAQGKSPVANLPPPTLRFHSGQVSSFSFTPYSFTLNGPAFATYLRDQLGRELAQRGELPRGLTLDTPELYRQMTGSGTLWVDAHDLPVRLQVTLDLGAQKNGERVTARLQTDFSDFNLARLQQSQVPLTTDPGGWWRAHWSAITPAAFRAGWLNLSAVGFVFLSWIVLLNAYRSRRLYTLLVLAVIVGLVVVPLIDAQQAYAFTEKQRLQQATRAAHQAEAEAQAQARETAQNRWNPHEEPEKQSEPLTVNSEQPPTLRLRSGQVSRLQPFDFAQGKSPVSRLQSTAAITTTDTDNDGLSDADEATWLTCPYAGGSHCAGVSNTTDSDGDGLTDGQEVNGLGLLPTNADTDGDVISDTLEVRGFAYNGQQWYLDPNSTDTNNDGLLDSADCPVWATGSSTFNASAICPDTDGDGSPDVFDTDNDNDGVPDADDASPNTVLGHYTEGNPFKLAVNNLQTNKPVFVSLQLRPTDASHLQANGAILDWPTGDTEGQITRYLNTTFATTTNSDLQSDSANAAYGDVRVVPVLEVTMPYSPGHYANLPVKPAYLGISRTLGLTVDQWLNTALLDPYGVSVVDEDSNAASGELVAYLPLGIVASSDGERTVAFNAQMVYSPTQASWGAAQEFRVVWLVQMMTDECIDPNADPDTCARQDTLTVIHTYSDTWQLTGLQVSEEHGLSAGVLYENPAQDPDLSLDHQLWAYSWNLSNGFLNGADCDSVVSNACVGNGQRDVTVANLVTVVPTWSTGNYVSVTTYTYAHSGYTTDIMMTQTKTLLNSAFAAYTATTYPTVLFAEEINRRALGLGESAATLNGAQLTLNFSGVNTQTTTALSWATYQYVDGAWGNMAYADYLTYLDAQLADESYFQPLDGSDDAAIAAEGKRNWAQTYYATLAKGLVGLAAVNNSVIWTFDSSAMPSLMYASPSQTVSVTGLSWVAQAVALALVSTLTNSIRALVSAQTFTWEFYYALAKQSVYYELSAYFKLTGWAGRLLSGMTVFATGAVLAVAGAALYAAGYFTGNATLLKVGTILLALSTIILQTAWALNVISVYMSVASNLVKLTAFVGELSRFAWVGFVLTVVVAWGLFAYMWATHKIRPGTVAFNQLLAYTIATTLYATLILLFQLAFPIVGSIVLAILAIIDAILTLLGEKTVTSRIIQAIADWLYDVDFIIENLSDADRLQLGNLQLVLAQPSAGFVASNGFYYTATVTNTIESSRSSNNGPRRATFKFVMQTDAVAQHSGLDDNQMPNAWAVAQEAYTYYDYGRWRTAPSKLRLTTTVGLTTPVQFAWVGTGINRNFSGRLYLTEGYAAPYQGCWQVLGMTVDCAWHNFNGSNHLNLGADIVFDILPATLSEFLALDWNYNGALRFATQTDLDGDGLLPTHRGGTDPSDTTDDADGDGLSDVLELTYGLDPASADSDSDGLTDLEEVAYSGSNPLAVDSDSDGLPDNIEVKVGWLVVYGYANGAPLLTRVWSNPYLADVDDDTLTDLEEFTFGFDPNVASDPSAIKDIIGFSNLGVSETEAALGLWRLEEGEGSAAFADSSGAGRALNCNRSANQCPTAGLTGRYGSAAQFDGNDYLTVTVPFSLSAQAFTIASWIYPTSTDTAFHGIMGYQPGGAASRAPSLWVSNINRLHAGFGDGANWNAFTTGPALTPNAWNHVAATFDGTTFKAYVNGAVISSTTAFAGRVPNSVGRYQIGRVDNHFQGTLDEAVIFDRALSASEIYALLRGRYNPDDGVLAPGQNLNYHATVTNTHASQRANGFLSANSVYANPAVAEPDLVLRFEDTDYVSRLTNSVGETASLYCLGDGTCPTTAQEGVNGQSLTFDGVNDGLSLPAMSEQVSSHSLAFWLKLNALPAAGQVEQILATDRAENGALNAYVDSNGQLWFTVQGNVGNYYLGYYTSTIGFNWAGYHYAARPMTTTLGNWAHYVFVYNTSSSQLFINGAKDSSLSYSLSNTLRLGPGTVGNNFTGTAPLNGDFDELVVYDNEQLSDGPNSAGYSDVDLVMGGSYWLYENINNVGDIVPSALFRFGDELGFDGTLFYDTNGNPDNAYCSRPTCPTLTAGYSGSGALFDGVNDYLTTTAGSGARNISLSFYVKLNSWPPSGTVAYILDSSNDADIYINANGKVAVTNTPNGAPLVSATPITVGAWVNVNIQFTDNVAGCTWGYRGYIYINGAQDPNYGSYWCSSSNHNYSMTFGPGRIGQGITNTNALSGTLDNYNIGGASYTFEIDDPVAVEVLDQLGGDNAACTEFVNCPTRATGKYGGGLAFSGDDYLTLENESKYDYSIVSVGAWIKVSPGGFTTSWQALITKGDGAWRLHRYANTSKVAFGTSGLSNADLPSTSNLDDGQWHYIMGVYDGAAKYLYVDGNLENDANVTGALAKNNYPVWIGENAQQTGRKFVGIMDEVVVLPEAVYTEGVRALMNTRYPPIVIADDFITYTAAALTSVTVSGEARLDSSAQTSAHKFSEEVEAALALQSAITIPVVDTSSSLLSGYFPFEDVPGSSTFENLISANDMTCSGSACPVAGLRGIADRAAYFDGLNDRLTISTTTFPTAVTGQTIALWVKADRGTLVEGFQSNLLEGVQLDVNRLYFRLRDGSSHYTRYTLNFDLPENEWTHLAATLNVTTQVASVYINGALVATTTFAYNASYTDLPPIYMFGANRYGGDYLHGYLDDARLYTQPLTAGQIQTLYAQSAPAMRFEFDEDETATTYADATPNRAVGYPNTQTCAEFTLNTATVTAASASTDNVYVQLDADWLLYDTVTNALASATRNLAAVICANTPLTVGVVANTGLTTTLGGVTLNPATSGMFTQSFSNGGNALTLNWIVGVAYRQPDPAPGTDGQIGNTGLFNGVSSYIGLSPTLTTLTSSVAGLTNTFSLIGWINPDTFPNYQWILAAGRAASNNGFGFGLKSNHLLFAPFGVGERVATNYDLDAGVWQQVAMVFDGSYTTYFYVDGLLKQTITGAQAVTRNTDDPLYIGASTRAGVSPSAFYEHFTGQIDELAVYSRPLSAAEIYSIYLRELRWYRDRSTTYLTVDTNTPTAALLTDYAYRANAYTQLAVSAQDATSDIALVEMGLQAPSAGAHTWSTAPRCWDVASVWCPAFDPTTLGGEGAYNLLFRAVDSVGNEITSTAATLYVDATPPTATAAYNGTWMNPPALVADRLSWSLTLSGTVSDPPISGAGVSGSGVATDSVRIRLLDKGGNTLGGVAQPATVTGNVWQIVYTASGKRPIGVYTLQLYAEDVLGNAMTATLPSTLLLDEVAPALQLADWQTTYPTTSITSTLVFTGLVGDYPDWSSALAQFHLEETSGSAFYDASGQGYVGGCITCPTPTASVFGLGQTFNAAARAAITVPASLGFELTNATLAAWVKPTWTSGSNGYNPTILAARSFTSTRFSWHLADNYSQMALWNGASLGSASVTLTPNQWQHLALVMEDGVWTAYVNGVAMDTVTQTFGAGTDVPLNIGSSTGSVEFFTGALDEVTVFDRALSADEVYALAQSNVQGVSNVQVGLEVFSFTGVTNTTLWQTATLSSPNALLTSWAYTLPAGLEDFYQINSRASDGFGNARDGVLWRGIIDELAPRLTFTATHLGSGYAAQTAYTVTVNDKFLDGTSLTQPCASADLTTITYTADLTRTSAISANGCRVDGHVTGPVSLTACDIVGHCATQTLTLTVPPVLPANVVISTPTVNSVITLTPATLAGGAYAPTGVQTVTVLINGSPLSVLPFTDSVTNTLWSTAWTPTVAGTYTVTALLNDGSATATRTVTYTPWSRLFLPVISR